MRRRISRVSRFWLIGMFLVALATTVLQVPGTAALAEGTSQYNFILEFTVKNRSSWELRSLSGEFPTMAWQELPSYQKVLKVVAQPAVRWNDNGFIINYKLDHLAPQEKYQIRIKYLIEHSSVFQDPPNIAAPADYGREMTAYLRSERGVEVGHAKLVAILSNLGADDGTPKEKARKIFAFVNETLDYKVDFNRDADALVALNSGWGRCEDYSMLFTALCRTAGIPARLVSGLRLEPKDLKADQPRLTDSGHMWVEIYLPSIGWISVDPTFLTTYQGKKVADYRFFAGFYDRDIHIFFHYGQAPSQVHYLTSGGDADLLMESKYYINEIQ